MSLQSGDLFVVQRGDKLHNTDFQNLRESMGNLGLTNIDGGHASSNFGGRLDAVNGGKADTVFG